MPILVNRSSRVLYQGVGGEEGVFDLQQCLAYGTNVVGIVDSNYDGKQVLGVPIFSTVCEAKKKARPNVSLVRVESPFAADAILEAEDSGIECIISQSCNLPKHDMVEVERVFEKNKRSRLLGPSSFGVITPEQAKVGKMPGYIFSPGPIGMISSADTLSYEAAWQMTRSGVGQSTCLGIGNEGGASFIDLLSLFEKDSRTEGVLLLALEEDEGIDEVISWAKKGRHKPLFFYIAGREKPFKKSDIVMIEDVSKIGEIVNNVKR